MEQLLTSEGLISLLTLTALEIVLGIDNVIFISIITGQLPEHQEKKARVLGLMVAMAVRILLLMGLTYIIAWGEMELFSILGHGFSMRDLILLVGGLFLMAKSTSEIHKKMEEDEELNEGKKKMSLFQAILQIVAIDVVFSFDSILTAVGLVDHVEIMIVAVVISMTVMIGFSQLISNFIEEHPTFKVLALSFLVLIGFLLVMEGFHYEIPKGYVYFAIGFSFIVEVINMRVRKKKIERKASS